MASTKKQRIKFDDSNIEVKPSQEDDEEHIFETQVKIIQIFDEETVERNKIGGLNSHAIV